MKFKSEWNFDTMYICNLLLGNGILENFYIKIYTGYTQGNMLLTF